MKLSEIMRTPIQTIGSRSPLRDAAAKMKSSGVGMLPVVEGERCIGVVTDRDIVVRAVSDGTGERPVEDVMTPNPVCLMMDDDVEAAMHTMEERRIGRVVVTDVDGRPVGVVSAGAIAIAFKGRDEVGKLASRLSEAHTLVI